MRRDTLPISNLSVWAKLNGVSFTHAAPKTGIVYGKVEKGNGIVATADIPDGEPMTLISVPTDLILTKEEVRRQGALDSHMKAVLDAAGELGTVSCHSRKSVVVVLLWPISFCLHRHREARS